jgi:tRNA-splicing ligase RtcB (3'-phosphate/5'-hydroxy nucleic acid ligase)
MTHKLTIFGSHEPNTIAQINACLEDDRATAGALCADGHLGYAQPVGGVVAYDGCISVSGVGFDIACGNMAVKTDALASDLTEADWQGLAAKIGRTFSFGIGRNNEKSGEALPLDSSLFDKGAHPAWDIPFVNELKRKAANQLGTIGSGNHYIDVFVAESDGHVWIGNHFGSRGLGHNIATHYVKAAGGKDGINVAPAVLPEDSDLGREYLMAMDLAGKYAYAGREWVARSVAHLMGAGILDEVHNHHNFAWREQVNGRPHWVVRKGATPLFPGQRGFVGGSMGDISVILRGAKHRQAGLLNSTVHGSGRVMSRTQAAGKVRWVKGKSTRISEGQVSDSEWRGKLAASGLILVGGGADEMPPVYRPLQSVLDAHAETFIIEEVLRPKIVAMAGANEYDPYKD